MRGGGHSRRRRRHRRTKPYKNKKPSPGRGSINNIHDYICGQVYAKSLKSFGWNTTVAQHYFTIGPMYLGGGLSDHGDEIVTPIAIVAK